MKTQELFLGVDLGATDIKSGLITPDGEIVAEKKFPTEAQKGIKHVLDRIEELVKDLIETVNDKILILGAGIGMPGLVNMEKGILVKAPNLPGGINVEVGSEFQKRLEMSVTVDNDANVAALAEFAYGAGKGVSEMFMITLGTGVGSGLILRGQVYRGARGVAGEFGHIVIQKDGPLCSCGRRGCVEAFVGTNGIIRRVKEKFISGRESLLRKIDPKKMTPKDISNAAGQGDELALEVFKEAGEYLGIGLGNVANLLNIERVVVGGGVANAGDLILAPARQSLAKIALKVPGEIIEVVPAVLGERAGIVGAARLAMLNR